MISSEHDVLLKRLSNLIETLAEQITAYDHVILYGECFDHLLFKPLSIKRRGYHQYIDEIKSNYQKLHALINNNAQDVEQTNENIDYLSEKMINQISALFKEIDTHQTRNQKTQQEKNTIFEQHAQYLNYLRKLQWIKAELEKNNQSYSKIQQVNERIERCKEAIAKVEDEIDRSDIYF